MSGQASVSECSHLDQINPNLRPRARGCEDCLATGDRWVHLRMCLTCGKVGCCDDSKNRHATKHFASVGHPLVRSIEPGEDWAWCYEDEAFLEPAPRPSDLDTPLGR
jgi:CPA2 family monovalent cation:H+ antiporter-2